MNKEKPKSEVREVMSICGPFLRVWILSPLEVGSQTLS